MIAAGYNLKATHAFLIKVAIGALVVSTFWHPRPLLVYNASASVPTGFYRVSPATDVRLGDLLLVRTPTNVIRLAEQRGYLPHTVPLIKHVAAQSGDQVCAINQLILINAKPAVLRLAKDSRGRQMPWWQGCHRLGTGEVFLLNPEVPNSFDGRYFGVVEASLIIGKVRKL